MARAKGKVVFSVAGASAEEKIGKYGFFEGSYTAILQFMTSKGLVPESIITINQKNTGNNFFIFYWKG